jgi:hypothetical protein
VGRIEPTGQAEEELGGAAERAFVGGPTSRLVKDCTLGAPFAGRGGNIAAIAAKALRHEIWAADGAQVVAMLGFFAIAGIAQR